MTLQLPNLGIRSKHYAFLRRPTSYLRRYKVTHPEALPLSKEPTKRQLKTAKAILRRLRSQKGVMLADDVGLGKTSVAALVACVFAGRGKSVRVLAPNATMARRWRHELSFQLRVVEAMMRAEKRGARGLDPERLSRAHDRMERFVRNLGAGDIQVTTHFRGAQGTLTCDLLVVDEAHRARSEWSQFGSALSRRKADYGRILLLTATPFSLRYSELSRALKLLGADEAVHEASDFGKHLEKLWKAEFADPVAFGKRVAEKGNNAVKALKSWVIRHGVNELPRERKEYGREQSWPMNIGRVKDEALEVIIRADRLLQLARDARLRSRKTTNDPRFHQGWNYLRLEMNRLSAEAGFSAATPEGAALRRHHDWLRRRLRTKLVHDKVAVVVRVLQPVVTSGEKVLVFCDHHATAQEITLALRKLDSMRSEVNLSQAQWRTAWRECLTSRLDADRKTNDKGLDKRFGAFLDWLACGAIRAQVGAWLRTRPATVDALTNALIRERARWMASGSIADEAGRLFRTLNDEDSRSTRAMLETRGAEGLPGWGTVFVPVMSGAEPPDGGKCEWLFYNREPDTLLSVFNSPFGPDVLVATDRLSEGIDLHRWCRFLVHYELDPSPIRTIQRRGRIRRIGSWAARTRQPIMEAFPCLDGTRDGKLVKIVRQRLEQFDLLLGGISQPVKEPPPGSELEKQDRALLVVQEHMKKASLAVT